MTDDSLDFKDQSAVYQEQLLARIRDKTRAPLHVIPTLAVHTKTKHKTRLTDGIAHPVTVRKATPEELDNGG